MQLSLDNYTHLSIINHLFGNSDALNYQIVKIQEVKSYAINSPSKVLFFIKQHEIQLFLLCFFKEKVVFRAYFVYNQMKIVI